VQEAAVFAFIAPDLARVWGIDISGWDKNVDLSVTKGRGASFVFIKAIDGTIQNSYFVPNRQRAKDARLLHAPYGWLYRDVNVSCVAQAQAYSNIVKQYPADLPPVIDFEWTSWGGAASNPTYADLDKWATEWLRLGNRKPILYSAAGYMNPLGTIPATLKAKFEGIWIANYGVVNPMMPYGYAATEWKFHQFTDSGDAMYYAPNDSGKLELDLNYFNGTAEQLYAMAGQSVPDGGDVTIYNLTAISSPTKRFANPDGSYDVGPNIPANTKLVAVARNGITYQLQDGKYVKYVQVRLDSIVEPPPVEPPPVEPPADGVADMPYTFTLGGGTSPYVETTITGIIKAK
jgi:GH25 family lysozyme M1 (1,4-beta-N-acetylmuramidase)